MTELAKLYLRGTIKAARKLPDAGRPGALPASWGNLGLNLRHAGWVREAVRASLAPTAFRCVTLPSSLSTLRPGIHKQPRPILCVMLRARKGLLPLLPWPTRLQWDPYLLGTEAASGLCLGKRETSLCYLTSQRCLCSLNLALSPHLALAILIIFVFEK